MADNVVLTKDPSLTKHATRKGYVDATATALAVAFEHKIWQRKRFIITSFIQVSEILDDAVYPKRCGTTKSKQSIYPKVK